MATRFPQSFCNLSRTSHSTFIASKSFSRSGDRGHVAATYRIDASLTENYRAQERPKTLLKTVRQFSRVALKP
jgi:hypothetical protein